MWGEAPIPGYASWPVVSLAEITTKIGSGATPRGGSESYLPVRERFALVRSQNVFDRRFDSTGLAFISDEQADGLRGVALQRGDILLNITGDGVTFGRACIVPSNVLPACVNQHVSIIRVNPQRADPGYVLSFLTHPDVKPYIESFNAGGSRRAITKGHIESFQLPLPPLAQQRAIAHILGTLDDKIELNRRMNETLEATARALFKSCFVDFEPVRAKTEGRAPKGMDAETAKLFPSEFEDSEKGEIPKGWSIASLDDIADFKNGLALQRFRPTASEARLPVVKIAQLRTGEPDSGEWARADIDPTCILEDGDVVFSWSGSLTVVVWCGGQAALNQHLFRVTSDRYPKWLYLHWLLVHLPEFQRIAGDKATTMGHIQRHHLSAAKCVIPSKRLLDRLSLRFTSLLEQRVLLDLQSRSLAAVRDALLPRLLSGELSVSHAERFIESTV